MSQPSPLLTIAMPAYDEAAAIADVVRGLAASLASPALAYEILVVDDGSRDGTAEACAALAATIPALRVHRHDRHRGLGAAWRSCIAQSRGEWVFVQPADGQVAPGTARRFFDGRGDSDVVIGVRARWPRPLRRRVLTRAFHTVTRLALGLELPEFGACFLFRGPLMRSLRTISGDVGVGIVSEWLYLARQRGAVMRELPVDLLPRAAGRSKSGHAADSAATLIDLMRAAAVHRVLRRG